MKIADRIIEEIVRGAATAPSGDNCQPWRFAWDGERLRIQHDEAIARHALNRHNRASWLSLGCVVEAISLTAGAHGFAVSVGPAPRELRFVATRRPPDPLHEWLTARATDRRKYGPGELPKDLCALLARDGVSIATRPSPELVRAAVAADVALWRDREVHADLMRWIRFDGVHADGMPWPTLGLSYVESRVLKRARRFGVQRVLNRLGFLSVLRRKLESHVFSAAAIWGVAVRRDDETSLVDAGRRAFRAWVRLNAAGFGVQPLYAVANRPETRSLIAREMGWDSQSEPVWLFRTGRTTPLPEDMRSPRRSAAELLDAG